MMLPTTHTRYPRTLLYLCIVCFTILSLFAGRWQL